MDVRVGCSGYFYRHWRGRFYPAELPTSQWFAFYAQHFRTLELNASFYRFPRPESVQRWLRQAPKGFSYAIKAPRLITHRQRLDGSDHHLAELVQVLAPLGDSLEAVLFQMPPSFHCSPEHLGRVLASLKTVPRAVVEFRHPSWWQESIVDSLDEAGLVFCSVHAPGLPDELVPCQGRIYLRMHGVPRYRQDYDERELGRWAERIRQAGASWVRAYFNNDADAAAPRNAQLLGAML
ncbi:MAG: DUF72 domain-containing protein [Zetaproteobacteria bacterium]|nr:MAG: DUF72 domain-containing protein [Zetaproteobacteria bacterium]